MARPRLTVVAERPSVGICAGKDCRKRSEFAKVRSTLDQGCDVVELKCIGVCTGPVVVIDPASKRPDVYSKLRSKRHRKLLVAVIAGERSARKRLANRRLDKKKLMARVARQLERRRSDALAA